MNIHTIEPTDPADVAFMKIAQGALVNGTTLPSGFVTPRKDMEIVQHLLVPVNRDEWLARKNKSEANS